MGEFVVQVENELQRLQRARAAAVKNVSEIDEKIRSLETFLGRRKPEPAIPLHERMSRHQLSPIIRDVLIDLNEPKPRGPLVDALADRGIYIGGDKPSRNLGTIMWRLRDQFINIEGCGYWPIDLPCEKIGYNPEAEDSAGKEAGAGGSVCPPP